MGEVRVVTEAQLGAFRKEELSPGALLAALDREVQVLFRIPVGVGKTRAAIGLLCDPATYEAFDLVLYAAPSWAILEEVEAGLVAGGAPARRTLKPRPAERCGSLDTVWAQFEKQGCGAHARATLCEQRCPMRADCDWPNQMSGLAGTRLVLTTEQRLAATRTLTLSVFELTGTTRPMIVLDEAQTLDADYEVVLTWEALEQCRDVLVGLETAGGLAWQHARCQTLEGLERLLSSTTVIADVDADTFPRTLHDNAAAIQGMGLARFGDTYQYIGRQLVHLAYSRHDERAVLPEGIRFIARPYLNRHLLLLSAHHDPWYVAHRLGSTRIASPFEDVRVRHTGTRVLNLTDSAGASKWFGSNHVRILDAFAVIVAHNIAEGRSTLLISRKKSKALVATYLEQRLRGWGLDARLLVDEGARLAGAPDPLVIPVVHYGILGVNAYERYDSVLCVNSYYVSDKVLTKQLTQFEPRSFQVGVTICRDRAGHRVAQVEAPELDVAGQVELANIYLRKLEVDPVVQAIGRVRPLTNPRLVVAFHAASLDRDLGPVQEVRTLSELLDALGLPSARQLDRHVQAEALSLLVAQGMTVVDAGHALGLKRRTTFRRRRTRVSDPRVAAIVGTKGLQQAIQALTRSAISHGGDPAMGSDTPDHGQGEGLDRASRPTKSAIFHREDFYMDFGTREGAPSWEVTP